MRLSKTRYSTGMAAGTFQPVFAIYISIPYILNTSKKEKKSLFIDRNLTMSFIMSTKNTCTYTGRYRYRSFLKLVRTSSKFSFDGFTRPYTFVEFNVCKTERQGVNEQVTVEMHSLIVE